MNKLIRPSLFVVFALALISVPSATYGGIAQGSQSNTKNGNYALQNNTTGIENTAEGVESMYRNTTGSENTASGFESLYSNTSGFSNTASGFQALYSNTTGLRNAAVGGGALSVVATGDSNTAIGNASMISSFSGNFNTAVGRRTLFRSQGDQNIALGFFAGSNLRNNGTNDIYIGNVGPVPLGTESNTIRIGTQIPATATTSSTPDAEMHAMPMHTDTYIAGIFGSSTATPGMPVYVDSTGKLGTLPSSHRFKKDVQPMTDASNAIFSLHPVTFRYKPDVTKETEPQFGLIAEEVAKVNPDLVVRDGEGRIHSVRYEAVNAMLLNEFLKEHRQVQEQQKQIDKLTGQLKAQAELIQKVSDKVEMFKTAPQLVANGH